MELEYVESEKMIQELHKRFDTFVLLAASNRQKDEDDVTICFGGPFHTILGMLELGRMAVEAGEIQGEE
jgi:hypothetical protein